MQIKFADLLKAGRGRSSSVLLVTWLVACSLPQRVTFAQEMTPEQTDAKLKELLVLRSDSRHERAGFVMSYRYVVSVRADAEGAERVVINRTINHFESGGAFKQLIEGTAGTEKERIGFAFDGKGGMARWNNKVAINRRSDTSSERNPLPEDVLDQSYKLEDVAAACTKGLAKIEHCGATVIKGDRRVDFSVSMRATDGIWRKAEMTYSLDRGGYLIAQRAYDAAGKLAGEVQDVTIGRFEFDGQVLFLPTSGLRRLYSDDGKSTRQHTTSFEVLPKSVQAFSGAASEFQLPVEADDTIYDDESGDLVQMPVGGASLSAPKVAPRVSNASQTNSANGYWILASIAGVILVAGSVIWRSLASRRRSASDM